VNCDVFNREIRGTSIQVAKQTVPAGMPDTFDFTLRNDGVPLDTIDDLGHGQTGTFDPVGPGTYAVTEAAVPHYTQQSASCDDLGTTPVETVDPDELTVLEGQNWRCTFVNAADNGTVTVVKHAHGADGTFSFTSNVPGLGDFQLATSSGAATSSTVSVAPGTYTLSESDPAPWTQTGAICSPEQQPGQFTVAAGQDVVCTFDNTAPLPTIQVS
jgi:hypothetical protein